MIVTVVPGFACCPPPGFWVSTIPSCVGSFVSCRTTCTLKPDALRSFVACDSSSLVTSGTADVVGPLDTFSVTVAPFPANEFPAGLWSTTVPFGWFESTSTRDTLKPAACSSELAESNDWPITGGTPIGFGPLETLMRTFVPWTTCVPPGGSCAITCPCGLSELIVCGSAFRCASVSAATASVDCSPTTDGTADFGLPLETVRLTVEPLSTRVPAVGA